MEKIIEGLLNRGYAYDSFRENSLFSHFEGLEDDVKFWESKYGEDIDNGLADPDEGVVEYIAGHIEDEHPTSSPEEFESLINWVAYIVNHKTEATIGGYNKLTNGQTTGICKNNQG